MVDELPEDGTKAAAFRWAVVVSEDSLMELQLQSLPGPAVLVAGKPTLKQYIFVEMLVIKQSYQ
jgi:hypothetical protein